MKSQAFVKSLIAPGFGLIVCLCACNTSTLNEKEKAEADTAFVLAKYINRFVYPKMVPTFDFDDAGTLMAGLKKESKLDTADYAKFFQNEPYNTTWSVYLYSVQDTQQYNVVTLFIYSEAKFSGISLFVYNKQTGALIDSHTLSGHGGEGDDYEIALAMMATPGEYMHVEEQGKYIYNKSGAADSVLVTKRTHSKLFIGPKGSIEETITGTRVNFKEAATTQ